MPRKAKLNKAILKSIGIHPLFWAYFESTSRTVLSGFALFAETNLHENGTPSHRRLYVSRTVEDAIAINELLKQQIPDKSIRTALEVNLDKVIDRWRCSLERNRIR
jgi:hypothetical protein